MTSKCASKTKKGAVCAARNCSNKKNVSSDKSFFRFPAERTRCREWVVACKRDDLMPMLDSLNYKSYRLCSDHFESKMFATKAGNILYSDAVPTLFPMAGSSQLSALDHNYSRLPLQKLSSIKRPSSSEDAGQSKLVKSIATDEYLSLQNCGNSNNAKNNCFFSLVVKNGNEPVGPSNWVFPGPLKDSNLQKPNVKIESVTTHPNDERVFVITISTDEIALFVWLETDIKGLFSENGFVQVSPSKTVTFHSEEHITPHQLLKSLTVTNLLDKQYL